MRVDIASSANSQDHDTTSNTEYHCSVSGETGREDASLGSAYQQGESVHFLSRHWDGFPLGLR